MGGSRYWEVNIFDKEDGVEDIAQKREAEADVEASGGGVYRLKPGMVSRARSEIGLQNSLLIA